MSHPKFFPSAKREGQVATLCKRDRAPTQDNECEDMYDGDCIYVHEGTYNRHDYASTSDDSFIPHGLCKVDSDEGIPPHIFLYRWHVHMLIIVIPINYGCYHCNHHD